MTETAELKAAIAEALLVIAAVLETVEEPVPAWASPLLRAAEKLGACAKALD